MSCVGYLQRPHPVAGHAGPDHLVVVERHLPAGPERPGLGLAHVVEQRRQAQDALGLALLDHRDGVGQHVLVAVDRVLLERQGRQLGQELLGQAGVDQEPQPVARVFDHHQLVQLVADPLVGHDLQAAAQAHDGVDQRRGRAPARSRR